MTLLDEIKSGRLRVVPVEATDEMLKAAGQYADHCAVHNYGGPPDADGTWDAMIETTSPDRTAELLELIEGLRKERDEARGVLSGLSSYLGAGLGDDATTAEQFDRRIREGIEITYAPMVQAWRKEMAR